MRRKKQLKRIQGKRVIPNIFTVLNMFLGFMAITQLLYGSVTIAAWLVIFAGMMDAIDGKLARMIGIPSKFGTEFDSFADTISFCVAPGILIYVTWVDGLPTILAGIVAFTPILFGTIRLAKFNLIQNENPLPFFVGLTTPLTAIGLFSYAIFSDAIYGTYGDPRIGIFLTMVMGILMVSNIRFSKFPILSFKISTLNSIKLVGILAGLVAMAVWKGIILFPVFLIFVTWSILNWMLHPEWKVDQIVNELQNENV